MKLLTFLLALALTSNFFTQLNITELGYLDLVDIHNSDASDIWGWDDGNGNEYAIVGLNDGTSVVDVTDPANPVEVFYEPGINSIWRDIKTYNGYAYVTTEAQNGLLIIDLNTLPGNTNLSTSYYTGPTNDEWFSAHNLFIDDNGICYIFGANRGNGGTIMLDLNSNPTNPIEVGIQDTYYVHDGVVRGDTLYECNVNDGFFTIWDVSNKANPVFLGQANTPGNFSHNLWFSDDGNYAYTTDEITNGFIAEYDISDPSNIIETDIIQSSPGMNVIPHNAHFIDDYIVTSYYRDGLVVHDVSNKGNMVEVGNFDTSPQFDGDGFNGCWGAFPWLPSGNVITSDIENGLHILGVNYTRGCYLEGEVTDANTSNPIGDVLVTFLNENVQDFSNINGYYKTGVATAGSYNVIFTKAGYVPDTIFNVALTNGNITLQNAQLTPIPNFDLTVEVNDISSNGIAGTQIVIENDDFSYTGTTPVSGEITFSEVYPGTYDITIGKWGYNTICESVNISNATGSLIYQIAEGYYDDFVFDFNWVVFGGATDGVWERGEPIGTSSNGIIVNPDEDVQDDCSNLCYVTGNAGGSAGNDDVDDSFTRLTSPIMDLSNVMNPQLNYNYWWINFGGSGGANDSLNVYINDGSDTYLAKTYVASQSAQSWQLDSILVSDFTNTYSNISIYFETADYQSNGGHLVEAGIDKFFVSDAVVSNITEHSSEVILFPNPSNGFFNLKIGEDLVGNNYQIVDATGKLISIGNLTSVNQELSISVSGFYLLKIEGSDKVLKLIVE